MLQIPGQKVFRHPKPTGAVSISDRYVLLPWLLEKEQPWRFMNLIIGELTVVCWLFFLNKGFESGAL